MSVLPLDPQTTALLKSLQSDYDATTPDAHIIARQIVYATKHKGKPAPKATDLAFSITGISHDHTTGAAGSPTLTLTMQDPAWKLLDSGFFDADPKTGVLLDLDVNYPEGSRFWWRLHQLSPQAGHSLQLVFVPRIIAELMGLFGVVKANRAKRTRAEFLKMLCAKVNDAQGPIEFYSRELDVKQPIGNSGTPSASTRSSAKVSASGKAAKHTGIGANRKTLTCKGKVLTNAQAEACNVILQVGNQLKAPHNALVAAIYAGMGESSLNANTGPSTGGAEGVFQTQTGHYAGGTDTAAQAHDFFLGLGDFGKPGAIAAANRGDPPWQIANETEVNAVWLNSKGDSYAGYFPGGQAGGLGEAAAIVAGGGGAGSASGGSGGTIEVAQPYYFMVNKGEDYWTAMNRLAQEVGWELVVDGNRIYYDADTELIRQKIAAVIDRDDPTTLAWNYDWENRHIATNFQIQVVMQTFEFCAGEVVQVQHFGAASTGSTAGLPGRWLIDEISHNAGDVYSTLSLVQPTKPLPEPIPQFTSKSISAPGKLAIGGSIQSQTPQSPEAAYAAAQYLASLKLVYSKANRTMIHDVGKFKGQSCYDCSASVSWVLLAAGFPLPGQVTWQGWAPVSGDYIAGGAGGALKAGPGQNMTIYANSDHVFIRIHPQGLADMQGNTVSPLVHMRGFDFFPWNTPGCGGWGGPSPGVGAPAFWMVHYAGQ